jgi:hypothetical protein
MHEAAAKHQQRAKVKGLIKHSIYGTPRISCRLPLYRPGHALDTCGSGTTAVVEQQQQQNKQRNE